MSVFIASINSGSNGNCYYIGNETEAVLVDAGISCRETEKRMRRMGLKMDKVRAIFISHEHTDHIYGAEVLSSRYHLPVYITAGTLRNSRTKPPFDMVRSFTAFEPVTIGGLRITGFPKWHDAADPHSFIVEAGNTCVGVFTDIGAPCDHVTRYFGRCHAAFLEANYDDEMLDKGRYPYHLKLRIRGEKGHLSNAQALALFLDHRPEYMSHVLLSHLSKDNNSPELAEQLFLAHAGNTNISVASRYNESSIFEVGNPDAVAPQPPSAMVQASLF
jgi:phosphoribosyl 1,2-cyclic phosphodiesterase